MNANDNSKEKILIVDDDEFLVDMYSVKFKESGFDIEIAFSGAEALEKIRGGFSPSIVLLDIVMPVMDGFEFLANIKKEKLIPNAKIIILSNLGQKDDIDKGIALGACDYVVKAYFTPTEIVNKINLFCK